MSVEIAVTEHPTDALLRADRLPHIWCPGCGLGNVTSAVAAAMAESGIPLDKQVVVSGIGCTGRIAGYLNVDSFHTTHGRAIAFATGLKLARPDLTVTVVSGDGDLFAIGGNHFLHAARRNIDLTVLCVNNFNYGMTGGQCGPTTPTGARTTTTTRGNTEVPFNLPHLAASLGAVYVARWTSLHVRQIRRSVVCALQKPGLTFIEVISPCPVSFGKSNDIGEGLDEMWMYRRDAVLDRNADPAQAAIDMRRGSPILVGEFVDIDRPVYRPQGTEG
jgi:2-oxoglutarate ferredoxin oxidoreductase subunit beta